MSHQGKKRLVRFKTHWQILRWVEIIGIALGPALLLFFVSHHIIYALLPFLILLIGLAVLKKPWQTTLENVTVFIDRKLKRVEYSSGLLLNEEKELSNIAKLQQQKVAEGLNKGLKSLNPPHRLKKAGLSLVLFLLLSAFASQLDVLSQFQNTSLNNTIKTPVTFTPNDSDVNNKKQVPVLTYQSVYIGYPDYIEKANYRSANMNIESVEGSKVSWRVNFNTPVKNVSLQSLDKQYPMRKTKAGYVFYTVLKESGFYNFQFTSLDGVSYTSDLYSIKVFQDKPPTIEIPNLKPFTIFSNEKQKQLSFEAIVADDYGVASAYIIATVSKGEGESVKFREEKLIFENPVTSGSKTMRLTKTIDLDELKMAPGDELYFYVEARDLKVPIANRSRSETYFASIKGEERDNFEVEGTMGIDQLPDYFRSQRQLIIDTEKLIKERPSLAEKDFKFRSNELGFDQKALRLKYAEFMGEENESGIAIDQDIGDEDHDDDHNPLAGYTHDHDSDNEHNLVSKNAEEKSEKVKDPLHEYLHNHDDPEESTLFTASLKTKLRRALQEMWDSELQLRVYKPELSLPFQYRALKLIQEIKNSARIYVHRIGFDPPPIKEEKRLSGKLEAIVSFKKSEELLADNPNRYMQEAVQRLAILKTGNGLLTDSDQELFKNAGNELANKAIESPGKYLKTLQLLKQFAQKSKVNKEVIKEVQSGLFEALPKLEANPSKQDTLENEINALLLKELEVYD